MPEITAGDFRYYDLRQRTASSDLGVLFPDWKPGDERVAVFSPHDDDAALGAGYAMLSALAASER